LSYSVRAGGGGRRGIARKGKKERKRERVEGLGSLCVADFFYDLADSNCSCSTRRAREEGEKRKEKKGEKRERKEGGPSFRPYPLAHDLCGLRFGWETMVLEGSGGEKKEKKRRKERKEGEGDLSICAFAKNCSMILFTAVAVDD